MRNLTYQEVLKVRFTINEAPGVDLRTTCDVVVAILLHENMGGECIIILCQRGRGLQQINDTPSAYNPLRLPFAFLTR